MQVAGSVALITGGASGLGAGTARRLIALGGKAALVDLPASKGAETAAELGDAAIFCPADVTNPDDVAAAVDHAAEAFGHIDVNVNAAGIPTPARVVSRDGDMFPIEVYSKVIGVNLIGAFDVLRNCARVMTANEPNEDGERGLIVNVASIAAFEGQVGQAAYSASKGGLVAMTLPLARDLAGYGIRVMTIAPGMMDTPMLAGMGEEMKNALASLHVFPKRLGTPDDFASLVVAFMENPLLNGEVVRMDAGARMPPR